MELKETDPRFLFLRSKIVLFSGVALVGAILLMFLIAKQKGILVKTEEVYFIADRATGLYTGMPVKVSGFKIGRLKAMSLQEDASVKCILSIEASEMRWLREDSFALLTKEGLIGESIIEIISGNGRGLKSGEAIRFERLKGMEEMAWELKAEITEILRGIKELLNYINNPQGDVKRSLSHLQKVSNDLIKTTDSLNILLENLNRKAVSIGEKAEVNLDLTQKRLEELSQLISAVRDTITLATKSVEGISKELLETSRTIKTTVDQSSGKIPALLEETKRNLEDLEEILQSIKGMWPIRKGIKKPEIMPIEGDTYER